MLEWSDLTEMKQNSLSLLEGRWGITGGLFLLLGVITVLLSRIPVVGGIISLLIYGAYYVADVHICAKVTKGKI